MLYEIFQIIASMLVTVGFAIIFNIRGKTIVHASIAGGLSWLFCMIGLDNNWGYAPTYFTATLVLALYAEFIAMHTNNIVTGILIPALIPLAPGGGIYYTVYNIIDKNYELASTYGYNTLIIAGSMAIGVLTAAVVAKLFVQLKKNIHI